MRPLDLTALSWNDFVANAVFFLLDVILLSILVPLFIRHFDNKKWSRARAKVGECSAWHLDSQNYLFDRFAIDIEGFYNSFPEAFKDKPEAHTEEGVMGQRAVLFQRFGEGVEILSKNLDEIVEEFSREIDILLPSFNSNLAIDAMEFYQTAVQPRSLALAILNYWRLVGLDDLSRIGVNPELQASYNDLERCLQRLCHSAGIRPTRSNDSLVIPVDRKSSLARKQLYPNHYPNHPTIVASLQRIARVLTSPINSLQQSEDDAITNATRSVSRLDGIL
jgi:hypothetical protein